MSEKIRELSPTKLIPHQEIIDNVKLKHRGGTVIGEARYVRYSKDHIRSDASVAYCLLMADQQNIHHWRFSRHLENGSQTATFHLTFDLAFPPSYIFPSSDIWPHTCTESTRLLRWTYLFLNNTKRNLRGIIYLFTHKGVQKVFVTTTAAV